MTNTVFITGSTGNIGGKLVIQLLRDDPSPHLVLLIRGKSKADSWERLERTLSILSPDFDMARARQRITLMCGDITQPRLGLSETEHAGLARRVTHIIHAAATTQFSLPLDCAYRVNYSGTQNVMSLALCAAATGVLRRVAHVSTAYVSGDRTGWILEQEVARPTRFSNTYEESKWESEQLVRSLSDKIPVTVFRPTIVVGDSTTGRAAILNAIYAPLRLICRGRLRLLRCRPDSQLDIVPVDYVASAIHHILMESQAGIGCVFQLVAGPGQSVTVGELVARAIACANSVNPREPIAPMIYAPGCRDQSKIKGHGATCERVLRMYEPYLGRDRFFDDRNTRAALHGAGILPVSPSRYLNPVLQFCFDTDWGTSSGPAALQSQWRVRCISN